MDRRTATIAAPAPPLATPDRALGERVRKLRNAHGLTQTELAEARVSKEYISQIETGKTRPTPHTVAWLAERLGVDRQFLEGGISERDYRETEAALAQAPVDAGGLRDRLCGHDAAWDHRVSTFSVCRRSTAVHPAKGSRGTPLPG